MIRSFMDATGEAWEVWEAQPTLRERRRSADRRHVPRGTSDRRTRVVLGYEKGWLVFRNGNLRRRLNTIPDGWDRMSIAQLRELLAKAARPSGALHLTR